MGASPGVGLELGDWLPCLLALGAIDVVLRFDMSLRTAKTTFEEASWVDGPVMPASVALGEVVFFFPGSGVEDPGGKHDGGRGGELGDD